MKTYEDAKTAIENLRLLTEENWIQFLKIQSNCTNYSHNNKMLLLAQNPNATTVFGYKAWIKQGRHVRKGEKSLRIFAPRLVKEEKEDGTERKVLKGYFLRPVFDISQTDGDELPTMERNVRSREELLSALKELSLDEGTNIEPLIQSIVKTYLLQEGTLDGLSSKDRDDSKILITNSVEYVIKYHYGLPLPPLFDTLENYLANDFVRAISEDTVSEYSSKIIKNIELNIKSMVVA